MKGGLLSLALFPGLLIGEMTTSSISSEHASYDGNALVLKGTVKLDHTLGKMESGSARLIREVVDGPFSSIYLHDQVNILLNNHGYVQCHVADFDFNSMTGTLNPKKGEFIHFENLTNDLSLRSKRAFVSFSRKYDELKIAKISTDQPVDLQYHQDFFLKAAGATFTDDKIQVVEASPNCLLTHHDDQIEAEKIQLYPESSKVVFSSPKGKLKPTIFSQTTGVDFSCDKLIWEHTPQLLTLKGHIRVEDEGIGTIESDDEVELKQQKLGDLWTVASIYAKGTTKLCCRSDETFDHTLISYGGMNLDGDRLVLTAQRSSENSITYLHDNMTLEADYAQLDYTQDAHKVSPQQLFLSGKIRLFSDEDHLRCAIADQFTYYPEKKTMILTAQNGERVLFWDKNQHLSISAKEVHITRTEKGENVKGVGNVRFAFSSTESTLLKKLFPFYQPQGDNS